MPQSSAERRSQEGAGGGSKNEMKQPLPELEEIQRQYKKLTPQRLEILRVLIQARKPMTAQQIHELVRASLERISLDTIYRNLFFLTEKGLVSQINLQNKRKARFEFQGSGHHHHAVCVECGNIFCIDDCVIPPRIEAPTEDPGFKIAGHAFEVYGICSDCQRKD